MRFEYVHARCCCILTCLDGGSCYRVRLDLMSRCLAVLQANCYRDRGLNLSCIRPRSPHTAACNLILHSVQAQEFAKICIPLFKQIAKCLNSSHFQVRSAACLHFY